MSDILLYGGFLVFWIVLNRWILPSLGVQTCMSGSCCQVPETKKLEKFKSQYDQPKGSATSTNADFTHEKTVEHQ